MPFCYDVETQSVREKAVVLSFAITYFDPNDLDMTIESLLEDTLFVKFDAKEQIKEMKRHVSSEVIDWWKKQCDIVRDVSFKPKETDVKALDGVNIIKEFVKRKAKNKEELVFTRGSLDQFVTDNLCGDLGVPMIFNYASYLDVRTALYCTKDTCVRGYCDIPGFDKNRIMKHNPVDDVIYDILMLVKGV
jgi:hypothetical protein